MTNYEWLKQKNLLSIIKDTLEKSLEYTDDCDEQTMAVIWLLAERIEPNVQLRENQTDVETRHDDPMS